MGFVFHRTGKYTSAWQKKTENPSEAERCKAFANARKLVCVIEFPQERRSSDYRQQFFLANTGLFHKGRYYQCAYCGKIIPRDRITVDHLISVKGTQKSRMYKALLHKLKITDINDTKNLVPACQHCNSKKGSKGGLWILRGIIGKSFALWVFRWAICIILIAFCVVFAICFQGSLLSQVALS